MLEHAAGRERVLFPCHNYKHAPVIKSGARRPRRGRHRPGARWSRCRPSATPTPRASPSGAPTGGASAATPAAASPWTTAATPSTWRSTGWAPSPRPSPPRCRRWGSFDTEDNLACAMTLPERDGERLGTSAWTAGVRKVIYTIHGARGAIRVEDDDVEIACAVAERRATAPSHGTIRTRAASPPTGWTPATPSGSARCSSSSHARSPTGDFAGAEAESSLRCIELIATAYASASDGCRGAAAVRRGLKESRDGRRLLADVARGAGRRRSRVRDARQPRGRGRATTASTRSRGARAPRQGRHGGSATGRSSRSAERCARGSGSRANAVTLDLARARGRLRRSRLAFGHFGVGAVARRRVRDARRRARRHGRPADGHRLRRRRGPRRRGRPLRWSSLFLGGLGVLLPRRAGEARPRAPRRCSAPSWSATRRPRPRRCSVESPRGAMRRAERAVYLDARRGSHARSRPRWRRASGCPRGSARPPSSSRLPSSPSWAMRRRREGSRASLPRCATARAIATGGAAARLRRPRRAVAHAERRTDAARDGGAAAARTHRADDHDRARLRRVARSGGGSAPTARPGHLRPPPDRLDRRHRRRLRRDDLRGRAPGRHAVVGTVVGATRRGRHQLPARPALDLRRDARPACPARRCATRSSRATSLGLNTVGEYVLHERLGVQYSGRARHRRDLGQPRLELPDAASLRLPSSAERPA